MSDKLLTRTEFRETALKRDNNRCVVCGSTNDLSVHHILERRLFSDSGYYLDNAATLCEEHHIEAEKTIITPEYLREVIGIKSVIIPEGYYPDCTYTKWGDVVLSNGTRMKGPLFEDNSVQKILKDCLNLYTDYVKYPRTFHLPWSEGVTDDDKVLKDCSCFENKRVIVTEKLDGENSTLYKNYYHARSIDGRNHWSRGWIKNLQSKIGYEIPEGWRFCGENLYATHSIKYDNLESYFYLFSIWNDKNECLNWTDTKAYADILEIPTVPVLYDGVFNEDIIKNLYKESDRNKKEGYVVRLEESFPYIRFSSSVAKFVRKQHVGTSHHWFFTASEQNILKS